MYNRWIYSDELMHHGRPRQKWHVRNGPPYPLYRQERFRSERPDGTPITSKKAYKKAMSVERAQKKEERSKHLNGTPEDHRERNSIPARIKRAYRQYRNDQKATVERNRKFKEDNDLLDKAVERVNDIEGLTEKEQRELSNIIAKQMHDSLRKGSENAKELADEVNAFADRVEKEHLETVKKHGTAEEVMKHRTSFTTDEWKEIADRLSQEDRVKKLLDKPAEPKVQNNDNKGGNKSQTTFTPETFSDKKTQKLYDRGRAADVWKNRDKFTPEQLNSIAVRIEAEDKIAKYANNAVNPKGNKTLQFEKLVDILSTMGKGADAIDKIKKLFPKD